ncbi:hypothetical protein BGZ70_002272 [Mortierella alpina]|uniref:Phytocyanin domain-containing protein n=1 Tax=Mortierella alpina TaxID=64518 RepID=A0A9P6IUD0_MORAP|nr:hypothetical protein BGZ70_002272 [Mortierella alpina]
MKFTALSLAAAIMAPVFAVTYEIGYNNGSFVPKEITIAPGNTIRWTNADGDHAIVQTIAAGSCNATAGGFNSGTKKKGNFYERTFLTPTTIYYKEGLGRNCLNGATGTIFVKAGAPPPTMGPSGTRTAAPISTATNGAGFLTPEKAVYLGVAGFFGALAL